MYRLHCMTLLVSVLAWSQLQAQIVPFSSEKWTINAKGHVIDAYEGKTNVLFLQAGSASLPDANFENGVVEFDLYLTTRRGFPGVMFRMTDALNYEEFYVRPHLSGMPDAMQYSPVYDGNSAWQLYHDQADPVNDGRISFERKEWDGFNTEYDFPYDRWLHIRLVISSLRADVYFDNEEKPTLQIRDLRRGISRGGVGVRTGASPFYFADFSYTPMDQVSLQPMHSSIETIDQYRIPSWNVSSLIPESDLEKRYVLHPDFLEKFTWKKAECELSGLINFSALQTRKSREENTILAKVIVNAQGDQLKKLEFGYSDRIKLYCNGELIYSGDNGYLSRDYRFLGTIGYFDAAYLKLKNGRNEIIFAVSETFGGWGIQAKLEDMEHVTLE